MAKSKSKRDLLRGRVIDLVLEFVTCKGGMSQSDLVSVFGPVFGPADEQTVTGSLLKIPAKISWCRALEISQDSSSETSGAKESASAAVQKRRESLVEKVIELVREFVNHNGGMSPHELSLVFNEGMVADALARLPLNFHRQ